MIEQTKQQLIIKEALDRLLSKGVRGQGLIVFEQEETDHYIQYELEEDRLSLYHSERFTNYNETLEALKKLLKSLSFEETSGFPLEEKEFCVLRDGLYACCGKDTAFLAYLSDRVFRDAFKAKDNYRVKANLHLISFP